VEVRYCAHTALRLHGVYYRLSLSLHGRYGIRLERETGRIYIFLRYSHSTPPYICKCGISLLYFFPHARIYPSAHPKNGIDSKPATTSLSSLSQLFRHLPVMYRTRTVVDTGTGNLPNRGISTTTAPLLPPAPAAAVPGPERVARAAGTAREENAASPEEEDAVALPTAVRVRAPPGVVIITCTITSIPTPTTMMIIMTMTMMMIGPPPRMTTTKYVVMGANTTCEHWDMNPQSSRN